MAPAKAGDFDGSQPLLCALVEVHECAEGFTCREVPPESVNAPRFFQIDFTQKRISAARGGGSNRTSPIERIERLDGKLILQGAEDAQEGVRGGLGWSLAIAEETGKMVLTGSGEAVGFVIFGACTFR